MLANAFQVDKGGSLNAGNPSLGAAIQATQAEINRVQQSPYNTGVGQTREQLTAAGVYNYGGMNVDPTTLVKGEGVYAYANDAVKILLLSAPIGATPGISTGATTSDANASRTASLRAAIAAQTKNVKVNTAAGKTANAKIDQASLDSYKKHLAALVR